MHILPEDKRQRIVDLHANGAITREIASAVGCAKETVAHWLGDASSKRRLHMADLLESVMDWIEANSTADWSDCEALSELHHMTRFSCPLHPEVDPDDMLDRDGDCPRCRSDGMRRSHERRNALGAPAPDAAGEAGEDGEEK